MSDTNKRTEREKGREKGGGREEEKGKEEGEASGGRKGELHARFPKLDFNLTLDLVQCNN